MSRVKWMGWWDGKILVGAILLLVLEGCLGGGPAPQDHYYRLELQPPVTSLDVSPLKGTLQILRPWADALTGERHIVYRQDSGTAQLHRHAYHRWVDSPTNLLQQEIAKYLRASNIAEQVVIPEHRTKSDYVLSCRMAKLERVLGGSPRVVIELELGLTHTREREAFWLHTYTEEQQANGAGVPEAVMAFNQALAHILDRFVVDVSERENEERDETNVGTE